MSENTGKMAAMIEQAEQDLLHTYNRYQVVLDHGDGVYLYDTEGKKYLDFMAGIGVFALSFVFCFVLSSLLSSLTKQVVEGGRVSPSGLATK